MIWEGLEGLQSHELRLEFQPHRQLVSLVQAKLLRQQHRSGWGDGELQPTPDTTCLGLVRQSIGPFSTTSTNAMEGMPVC